jgi:hypothetical protein
MVNFRTLEIDGELNLEEPQMTTLNNAEIMSTELQNTAESSAKITELERSLTAAQEQYRELNAKTQQQLLEAKYWKVRAQALYLYAFKNQMTENEFNDEFSEDPQTDVEKLIKSDPEEARLDLRYLEKTVERAGKKQPSDRVTPATAEKLNRTIATPIAETTEKSDEELTKSATQLLDAAFKTNATPYV